MGQNIEGSKRRVLSLRQVPMTQQKEADGSAEVFEAMQSVVCKRRLIAEFFSDLICGLFRENDLTAVSRAFDSSRVIDNRSEIVSVGGKQISGVETDSNPHLPYRFEGLRSDETLHLEGALRR